MWKIFRYFSKESREVRRIKKWIGNRNIKAIEVSRNVYERLQLETPEADPKDFTCHNIHYSPYGSIKVLVNDQMKGSTAKIII